MAQNHNTVNRKLARRIQARYIGSPGVVALSLMERTAVHRTRLPMSRHPLSSAIQRRWLSRSEDGWQPLPVLVYLQRFRAGVEVAHGDAEPFRSLPASRKVMGIASTGQNLGNGIARRQRRILAGQAAQASLVSPPPTGDKHPPMAAQRRQGAGGLTSGVAMSPELAAPEAPIVVTPHSQAVISRDSSHGPVLTLRQMPMSANRGARATVDPTRFASPVQRWAAEVKRGASNASLGFATSGLGGSVGSFMQRAWRGSAAQMSPQTPVRPALVRNEQPLVAVQRQQDPGGLAQHEAMPLSAASRAPVGVLPDSRASRPGAASAHRPVHKNTYRPVQMKASPNRFAPLVQRRLASVSQSGMSMLRWQDATARRGKLDATLIRRNVRGSAATTTRTGPDSLAPALVELPRVAVQQQQSPMGTALGGGMPLAQSLAGAPVYGLPHSRSMISRATTAGAILSPQQTGASAQRQELTKAQPDQFAPSAQPRVRPLLQRSLALGARQETTLAPAPSGGQVVAGGRVASDAGLLHQRSDRLAGRIAFSPLAAVVARRSTLPTPARFALGDQFAPAKGEGSASITGLTHSPAQPAFKLHATRQVVATSRDSSSDVVVAHQRIDLSADGPAPVTTGSGWFGSPVQRKLVSVLQRGMSLVRPDDSIAGRGKLDRILMQRNLRGSVGRTMRRAAEPLAFARPAQQNDGQRVPEHNAFVTALASDALPAVPTLTGSGTLITRREQSARAVSRDHDPGAPTRPAAPHLVSNSSQVAHVLHRREALPAGQATGPTPAARQGARVMRVIGRTANSRLATVPSGSTNWVPRSATTAPPSKDTAGSQSGRLPLRSHISMAPADAGTSQGAPPVAHLAEAVQRRVMFRRKNQVGAGSLSAALAQRYLAGPEESVTRQPVKMSTGQRTEERVASPMAVTPGRPTLRRITHSQPERVNQLQPPVTVETALVSRSNEQVPVQRLALQNSMTTLRAQPVAMSAERQSVSMDLNTFHSVPPWAGNGSGIGHRSMASSADRFDDGAQLKSALLSQLPELPLAHGAQAGAGADNGHHGAVQSQAANFSTPGLVTIQRAATSVQETYRPPAAGIMTPGRSTRDVAPAGLNNQDLERIAGEVYTILERRLIFEREAMGL